MKKRIVGFLVLALSVSTVIANADEIKRVVGFKSINNMSSSDLKIGSDLMESFMNSYTFNSNTIYEKVPFSEEQEVISGDSELSYLVTNNILSRDVNFNYDKLTGVTTSLSGVVDYSSMERLVNKDLFLMTLAKSVYGVEYSRPIIMNTVATRIIGDSELALTQDTNGYIPNGTTETEFYNYTLGDYYIYYTPNVYEIYFRTLIQKGVIDISEFSNIEFQNQINSYSTKDSSGNSILPAWSNSLSNYDIQLPKEVQNVTLSTTAPLGQSFNVKNGFADGYVNYASVEYFFNNNLMVIDALKYIESALRLSEKAMTNTEAEVINYKYGASYLLDLDNDVKNTVMFLVAKGVLNFENVDEFNSLFRELDYDFFVTLMYRVANENARVNFSELQLTDSDNYWLSKGLYKSDLDFYFDVAPQVTTEVKVVNDVSIRKSDRLFGLISFKDNILADSTDKSYSITKSFNTSTYDFYYEGALLKGADSNNILVHSQTITAKSEAIALAIYDTKLTYKSKTGNVVSVGGVPSVSKVTSGKVESVYVSKTALMQSSSFAILFTEDKFITNTQTGSRALLLNDNNIAIVGNEIVKTTSNQVIGINGEVYYNLEIIAKLFNSYSIKALDPTSVYISNSNKDVLQYPLYDTDGNKFGSLAVGKFKSTYFSNIPSNVDFMDITNSNTYSNFVIQDVASAFGKSYDIKMVVEFVYGLPNSVADTELAFNVIKTLSKTPDKLMLDDVFNGLYRQPESSELTNWWNSNIIFNNALINFLMNTTDVNYMYSGYYTPKVTFLVDNSSEDLTSEELDSFFIGSLKLSQQFTTTYGKHDTTKSFVYNYFKYNNNNSIASTFGGVYNSLKNNRTLTTIKKTKIDGSKDGYTDYNSFVVTSDSKIYSNMNTRGDIVNIANSYAPKYQLVKSSPNKYKTVNVNNIYDMTDPNGKDVTAFILYVGAYTDIITTVPSSYSFDDSFKYDYGISDDTLSKAHKYVSSMFGDFELYKTERMSMGGSRVVNSSLAVNGIYYWEAKFHEIKDGVIIGDVSSKDIKKGQKIYYFPKARISTDQLADDSGNLVKRLYNPVFELSNISSLGITSQIIDGIVYKNSGYIKYSEIPDGSQVYIGKRIYYKSSDKLQSDIIGDTNVASRLSRADLLTPKSYESLIHEVIGNVPIVNTTKSSAVSLSNYIPNVGIGTGWSTSDFNKNTLIDTKEGFRVKSSKSRETVYVQGQSNIDSFAISFTVTEDVRFRPLDGDSTVYTLVSTINGNVDGYAENIPYYSEMLSFEDSALSGFDVSGALYKPAKEIDKFIDGFFLSYEELRVKDTITLIKGYLSNIAVLMMITNAVVFIVSRSGINRFFTLIRESKSGGNGFDIYRIVSLGLQTADGKMGFAKFSICILILLSVVSILRY